MPRQLHMVVTTHPYSRPPFPLPGFPYHVSRSSNLQATHLHAWSGAFAIPTHVSPNQSRVTGTNPNLPNISSFDLEACKSWRIGDGCEDGRDAVSESNYSSTETWRCTRIPLPGTVPLPGSDSLASGTCQRLRSLR